MIICVDSFATGPMPRSEAVNATCLSGESICLSFLFSSPSEHSRHILPLFLKHKHCNFRLQKMWIQILSPLLSLTSRHASGLNFSPSVRLYSVTLQSPDRTKSHILPNTTVNTTVKDEYVLLLAFINAELCSCCLFSPSVFLFYWPPVNVLLRWVLEVQMMLIMLCSLLMGTETGDE